MGEIQIYDDTEYDAVITSVEMGRMSETIVNVVYPGPFFVIESGCSNCPFT